MTGELKKKEICDNCPIENPRIGHCFGCSRFMKRDKGHQHVFGDEK